MRELLCLRSQKYFSQYLRWWRMNNMASWTRQKTVAFYYDKMIALPRGKQTSRKYLIFERPDGKFYYVGKKGAIRVGRNLTDSISLTDQLISRIEQDVAEYRKNNPEVEKGYKI
jgi:glutaredoxin 2